MICSDQAIVLKTYDFRETSKIVLFYSMNYGKMSGLFKGIRKDPRKFASNLEFLSINEIVFYKKIHTELHLVSQCDQKKFFASIKKDMIKFGLASFCAELINAISAVEDRNTQLYSLFVSFLEVLDQQGCGERHVYNFILRVLNLSGFKPHLDDCIVCNTHIQNRAYFSHSLGGLLCPICSKKDRYREDISKGTISSLLYFQRTSWPQSLRLNVLPGVKQQLRDIIFTFLNFHLEKEFKSLPILNELLDHSG